MALAEHVGGNVEGFIALMNKKANELNLKSTHFVTPHGLDNEEHYTTAYELAILTDYALQNSKFASIVNTKSTIININGSSRTIGNTNELLGYLNGVNGVKTGFTNGAGRCLVTSCTRNNNQIITVVLGCDTKKQRTSDSIKLIEYAFKNYTRVNIEQIANEEFKNWKRINNNRIYIYKGESNNMDLELANIKRKMLPLKKGEKNKIKVEINLIYLHEAPVEQGKKVGNLIIKKGDEIIETVDIKCKNTINKKDIMYYMKELLGNMSKILIMS